MSEFSDNLPHFYKSAISLANKSPAARQDYEMKENLSDEPLAAPRTRHFRRYSEGVRL